MPLLDLDLDRFNRSVRNSVTTVFQRASLDVLGGPAVQASVRQQLQGFTARAAELGIDLPFLRDIINSVSDITGIFIGQQVRPLRPTIFFNTKIEDQDYTLALYDSDEELEFNNSVNWNDVSITGRSSPLFSYVNSNAASFNLTGYLLVNSADDTTEYNNNLSLIKAMKYPVNFGAGVGSPPIWNLTVLTPYFLDSIFFGPERVRVNSVSYTPMKPYLSNGLPAVTRVNFDLTIIEEQVRNSQVTYGDAITGVTSQYYFRDIARTR